MKTVLCHGVFDLLHVGHVWTLRWASGLGARLVVTVTPDGQIVRRKGRKPVYPLAARMELLDALEFVDLVVPARGATALWSLATFKPAVWVRGSDWRGRVTRASVLEEGLAAKLGTAVKFAPRWHPDYRSSDTMRAVLAWNNFLER